MKNKEPLEAFNVAQAQIKIFEALTESMQGRIDQYTRSHFGKKVDFNYEKLGDQLIKDFNLAMELCKKLEVNQFKSED